MKKHLFTSQRLGFRNWINEDTPRLFSINSDPKVMEFFPTIPSKEQTVEFINKIIVVR